MNNTEQQQSLALFQSTPSSAPSPVRRVSIHDLPTELVTAILWQVGSLDEDAIQVEHGELYEASLVCTFWASIIGPLLWLRLLVTENAFAKRIMKSPAFGRYQTVELDLRGYKMKSGTAIQLLERLKGIKELTLCGFQLRLGARVFGLKSLAELGFLYLLDTFLYPLPTDSSFTFEHSLTKLMLQFDEQEYGEIPFETRGLLFFPIPAVTRLYLYLDSDHPDSNLRDILRTTLPQVEYFTWGGRFPSSLFPLFREANQLTALEHVSEPGEFPFPLIEYLPNPSLRRISLTLPISSRFADTSGMKLAAKLEEYVKAIGAMLKLPQLEGLEVLKVGRWGWKVDSVKGLQEVFDDMKERGVRVVHL